MLTVTAGMDVRHVCASKEFILSFVTVSSRILFESAFHTSAARACKNPKKMCQLSLTRRAMILDVIGKRRARRHCLAKVMFVFCVVVQGLCRLWC